MINGLEANPMQPSSSTPLTSITIMTDSNKPEQRLWEKCLAYISDVLASPEQYSVWFEPLTVVSYQNESLTLFAPSEYFIEQLELRYIKLLKSAIRRFFGENTRLFYKFNQVSADPSTGVTLQTSNASPAVKPGPNAGSNPFYSEPIEEVDSQLNPEYTFENYCSGRSNLLARSLGEAIAENPRQQTFNPMFVFGPTGVGKTHLIQAIGIRIKERNPKAKVLYITARLFESQFTTALHEGKINGFIRFYQSIDTLIIDDIQDFIGNKPRTQNAFFHIFNHLHQNQKQLILSSDTRPSEMEGMEERLLSRFKWGVTAELEKPDLELRRDVLNQKSLQDGLTLPGDVLNTIAESITGSVRELEGVVASLLAHATLLNRDIDINLAKTVIANTVKIRRRNRVLNFELIAQRVSAHYGVDADDLFSKSRKREISDARQMLMFMAKRHAHMPLTAIGVRLSRTHATVLYACRQIEERLAIDPELRAQVAQIETALLA